MQIINKLYVFKYFNSDNMFYCQNFDSVSDWDSRSLSSVDWKTDSFSNSVCEFELFSTLDSGSNALSYSYCHMFAHSDDVSDSDYNSSSISFSDSD